MAAIEQNLGFESEAPRNIQSDARIAGGLLTAKNVRVIGLRRLGYSDIDRRSSALNPMERANGLAKTLEPAEDTSSISDELPGQIRL